MEPDNLRRSWEQIRRAAGIGQVRFHDYADVRVMPTSGRTACSAAVNGLKVSA